MMPEIIAFIVIGSFATFFLFGLILMLIDSEKAYNEKHKNK
jgi:hypothetical protein|tara:strand:- start:781 stop:903 length:123 start_codon:yes stop_codon:yes gene_type:complete